MDAKDMVFRQMPARHTDPQQCADVPHEMFSTSGAARSKLAFVQ
jgi:hypothetical protein